MLIGFGTYDNHLFWAKFYGLYEIDTRWSTGTRAQYSLQVFTAFSFQFSRNPCFVIPFPLLQLTALYVFSNRAYQA